MKRYLRSKHLQIEHSDGESWTMVHGLLGTRLQVNKAAYRLLKLFDEPLSLEELAQKGRIEKARPFIERFIRNHFLIEAENGESISAKIVHRTVPHFFNCPFVTNGDSPVPDVTFLGIPFDYGNTADPGARYGPTALRKTSAADFRYTLNFASQRPNGWYDNDWERAILQGVTMADAGDIFIYPGESTERIFQKITEAARGILGRGSFPVFIGGDHSITYPTLSAYETPVSIIHIDAHSDFAAYYPEMENHHGNVMSRVRQLPHVGQFYQIGLRGTTPQREGRSNTRAVLKISPRRLRQMGLEALLERIPETEKYYVSLDIDALDPVLAPGTSTPMPGGLYYEETKELLWAVGRYRDCCGFDLVEVNPRRDVNDLTSAVAVELLLAFLAAHFAARGEHHE